VLHTIFSPYCLSPSGVLAAPEDVRLVNKSVIFIYGSFFRANEVDFFPSFDYVLEKRFPYFSFL